MFIYFKFKYMSLSFVYNIVLGIIIAFTDVINLTLYLLL